MKCNYPNCHKEATVKPIVSLPTVRVSAPYWVNGVKHEGERIQTDKPTLLEMVPVCQDHADRYNLDDWIKRNEWESIRDGARDRGMDIGAQELIRVIFNPILWEPPKEFMEIHRN